MVHPASGGADLDWEDMNECIKENSHNQLQHIEVADYKLDLRQIYSLSKMVTHLGHSIKVLKVIIIFQFEL